MGFLLHIETTGDVCSVALSNDRDLISLKENDGGRSHASLLTVFVDDILKENNLTGKNLSAVCVSKGPGSYTGLRIGVAAAKGICYAASVPLIGINTLESMTFGMAARLEKENPGLASVPDLLFCPLIDARRLEVYTAFLAPDGHLVSGISALILKPGIFDDWLLTHHIIFFGSGVTKAQPLIAHQNAAFISGFHNSAAHLLTPAWNSFSQKRFEDLIHFEPFYLKDFMATTPRKKL